MPIDEPQAWQGVTDQVMGGVSNLAIRHADGVFYMSGNVSTDNNGGFVRLSNRININSNDFKGIKFNVWVWILGLTSKYSQRTNWLEVVHQKAIVLIHKPLAVKDAI